MAKEKFEDRKLYGSIKIKLSRDDHSCGPYWETMKEDIVRKIVHVVEDYASQGYKLTLRQLYYQLVAREWIPNDDKVYGKLSALLDDCRYSGVVNWDHIEDRGRVPHTPYYEDSVESAIEYTKSCYKLDKRKGQPIYTELWTEKDAISNILKDAVNKYTITVGINKGFTSSTAIHNAYERFVKHILRGKRVKILYFGDHDPSGLDMVRDIRERLEFMMIKGKYAIRLFKEFTAEEIADFTVKHDTSHIYTAGMGCDDETMKRELIIEAGVTAIVKEYFEVRHIGLTKQQINEHKLPPNPAKISDPRAKGYIREHGEISWEVDALQPEDLKRIVTEEVTRVIDEDILNNVLRQEEEDIEKLNKIIKGDFTHKYPFEDEDEWGDWTCPHCGSENSDPESVHETQCGECENTVVLSDVVDGKRKAKKREDD